MPLWSEVVVTASCGEMFMDSDVLAVCAVGIVESVAMIPKLKVPDADGVPVIDPEDESESPEGRAPDVSVQV